MKRHWTLLVGMTLAAGACKAQRAPPAPPPPPPAPAPSFSHDVLPVMIKTCNNAEGCHGDMPTYSVKLDLQPANAWAQLVGAPSEERHGALRVKPGDPEASFLVDKLTGAIHPGEGKRMPIDAVTGSPLPPTALPDGYVEKVLVPWIRAGAKDD